MMLQDIWNIIQLSIRVKYSLFLVYKRLLDLHGDMNRNESGDE